MESINWDNYIADRDAALLSLDTNVMRLFAAKYNLEVPAPDDDFICLAAMHKAITGATSLPMEARSKSKAWLKEHKMKSLDDGDVP